MVGIVSSCSLLALAVCTRLPQSHFSSSIPTTKCLGFQMRSLLQCPAGAIEEVPVLSTVAAAPSLHALGHGLLLRCGTRPQHCTCCQCLCMKL